MHYRAVLKVCCRKIKVIEALAEDFRKKVMHSSGRGDQYPIAVEGALKLKEISLYSCRSLCGW